MLKELEKLLSKMESPEVSVDDVIQWRDHPVTKRLYADFLATYADDLTFLSTNLPVDDATRALHASTVGKMDAMKRFLDYVEDTRAELEESENEGN